VSQVGGNGGHNGGNYFHGIPHQRGWGFFGDLRRFITPLALRAGRYLGKHLLHTGSNVLSDVASGSSLKDAARSRMRETSKKIKSDVFEKLQQGEGIKRKRKRKKCQSKSKCRKTKRDIFT
jgi:hypothetical protein